MFPYGLYNHNTMIVKAKSKMLISLWLNNFALQHSYPHPLSRLVRRRRQKNKKAGAYPAFSVHIAFTIA
jgi:hypothetical protein